MPRFRFDQLYVVSDLHFGGEPGFQIFGSKNEMVWLLHHLADLDPGRQIALVINGDFLDFLAEAPAVYFDPYGAVRKLDRIATEDPTFAPIFNELRHFVSQPGRTLIINLGNHDLELALPWVRHRLVELLSGGKSDALAQLHLVFDGSGVLCEVAGHSVLCVHGNEVDRWNPADFETIREIGRDVQLGRSIESWTPNAGTKMVIDVMNPVKRHYPFVDLLKPEKEGVVPTLAACDPEQIGNLDRLVRLASVGASRLWAGITKPRGMLGEEETSDANGSLRSRPNLAGVLGSTFPHHDVTTQAEALMRSVEDDVRRGTDPMTMVEGREAAQLNAVGAFFNWITGQPPYEVLREALEKLDKDRSFDTSDRDETAKALDEEISPAIDFIIAGHTHLERALRRQNGSGLYFNSGTWARLIRIAPEVRGNTASFKRLFETLQDGTMTKLDAEPGVVVKPCTVVAIRRDAAGAVTGELLHVESNGAQTALQPVPNTRFLRTS